MAYHLIKSLHVLAVVLFLGNILVTAVWKTLADRTRNPQIIAFSQRLVTLTDLLFTGGGAALVLGTGLWMVPSLDMLLDAAWLFWSLICFGLSGFLWLAVLIPTQMEQSRLAHSFGQEPIPQRYWQLSRRWAVFGTCSTLVPLFPMVLMILKPA